MHRTRIQHDLNSLNKLDIDIHELGYNKNNPYASIWMGPYRVRFKFENSYPFTSPIPYIEHMNDNGKLELTTLKDALINFPNLVEQLASYQWCCSPSGFHEYISFINDTIHETDHQTHIKNKALRQQKCKELEKVEKVRQNKLLEKKIKDMKNYVKNYITDHQKYNKFHKLYFDNNEVVKIEHPKVMFPLIKLKIHLWDKKSIYSKSFIFRWNKHLRNFHDENAHNWRTILSFECPDAKQEILKKC